MCLIAVSLKYLGSRDHGMVINPSHLPQPSMEERMNMKTMRHFDNISWRHIINTSMPDCNIIHVIRSMDQQVDHLEAPANY